MIRIACSAGLGRNDRPPPGHGEGGYDGVITAVQFGSTTRAFDYGNGPRRSLNVSWADVATAYYTTGIPNITTYSERTPVLEGVLTTCRYFDWALRTPPWQLWLKAQANLLPKGPAAAERNAAHAVIVAEATDSTGRRAAARLRTPEAYSFTAMTASAIARRVVRGDFESGFQTLEERLSRDVAVRCVWQVIDLTLATMRGVLGSGIMTDRRGFDVIEEYDCREWLLLNGAAQSSVDSGWLRALYDFGFSYEDGDATRPRIAASQGVRAMVRAFSPIAAPSSGGCRRGWVTSSSRRSTKC